MTAQIASLVVGCGLALFGLLALLFVAAGRQSRTEDADELAVARAAGVLPPEHDEQMCAEERAGEVAWLVELFAASPDYGPGDCPIVPGRDFDWARHEEERGA